MDALSDYAVTARYNGHARNWVVRTEMFLFAHRS
jgi:hypothetical protein